MVQVPLTVSHLPSSTSFFLACLQPLGYKYVARQSECVGFGIIKGQQADFWLVQGNDQYPAGTAHATFPAATRDEAIQFMKFAIRAGGRSFGENSLINSPTGGCSATIIDLDGNTIEAIYQPGHSANSRPSPVVRQHKKNARPSSSAGDPQRNSMSGHGKTVIGTLAGVAAGVFVAYKMYNKSSGKEEAVPVYEAPVPQVLNDRPPQQSYGPVQPRQLAIEGADIWGDRSSVGSTRCQTIFSEDHRAASVASAVKGLEDSTAAWSINDDGATQVSKSSRRPHRSDSAAPRDMDSNSIAPSRASSFHPPKAPSTFISEFDARTVTLRSQERTRESGSRRNRSSSRAPPSRASAAPSTRSSGTERRKSLSKEISTEPTLVPSKVKSILKPSSASPSYYTSREESVVSQGTEATRATHKSHRTERTSRSHRSRSHARSRSHVSRRDRSPVSGSSSGEETYHLPAYPAHVAPGKPMPKSQVYVDENGYDSEATATATDLTAGSRASKGYTPRAHRHRKSHRSHSVSGRSHSRRRVFDEEVGPDDSVSQVC